jgi:hypothetical protein
MATDPEERARVQDWLARLDADQARSMAERRAKLESGELREVELPSLEEQRAIWRQQAGIGPAPEPDPPPRAVAPRPPKAAPPPLFTKAQSEGLAQVIAHERRLWRSEMKDAVDALKLQIAELKGAVYGAGPPGKSRTRIRDVSHDSRGRIVAFTKEVLPVHEEPDNDLDIRMNGRDWHHPN